jgi:hypothetical protein
MNLIEQYGYAYTDDATWAEVAARHLAVEQVQYAMALHAHDNAEGCPPGIESEFAAYKRAVSDLTEYFEEYCETNDWRGFEDACVRLRRLKEGWLVSMREAKS